LQKLDRNQLKKNNTMKALVYRSTGSWYDITDEYGRKWRARIKGAMRIDGITSTNPIAVGDWVDIDPENELEDTAMIYAIHDRTNYISRQSPHNKNLHHIVAANLDQSLLIATLKDPRTSQGFIDRFLVASEAYHVPAIIVFNKKDTWRKKEMAQFEAWQKMYEAIGYKVMAISVQEKQGLDEIQQLLKDKTTLLSGHSGVGKSSFLNAAMPGLDQHTKEVSEWSGKGMHTTTFAQMFDLPYGGKVIDTPGVREFGIVHIKRSELSQYFKEMRLLMPGCQFNDCLHINEPDCAVKMAVTDTIPEDKAAAARVVHEDRYVSYLTIMDSIPEKEW
jgi:ribosome biogenesis GTPase